MPIIKIKDTGAGVNKDLTPEELNEGVWSSVENMRFRDGYAQRFKGIGQLFDPTSVTPYYVAPYVTELHRYWIHAGVGRVFADNGTARTEITPTSPFTGSVDDRWSSAALGGVFVMTNSVDSPHYWGGQPALDLLPLPAWPSSTRCHSISAFKNHLVALDIFKPIAAATISSITNVTITATLTTSAAHGLETGNIVTVSGATPSAYNGSFAITVTSATTFTYVMLSDPGGAASVVGTYVVVSKKRYPHMVKWSNAAAPGSLPTTWDETDLTQDAGEVDLADTHDLLIDALALGDSLIIYKERSAYSMRYVGQPFIFQFQRIPGDIGMLFRGCGDVTPVGHVVLAAGDVVLCDGNSFKSIADGVVRRHIFKSINTQNYKKTFVCTNPQKNEVLICYPSDGSEVCNKAAVWNWDTGLWGFRDLPTTYYGESGLVNIQVPTTWATDSDRWDFDATDWSDDEYSPNESRLILACNGKIAGFDIGSSDDDVNILNGSLERVAMTFSNPYANKLVRAVYPRVEADKGSELFVQVGASMNATEPPIWSNPVPFRVGEQVKADSFAQGRYLSFRFYGAFQWRMRSFDVDMVDVGAY